MTHDPRAREVADNLALAVGNACCYLTTEPDVFLELRMATGDAIDVLRGRAGLRVVSAEPSDEDVERAADAIWRRYREDYDFILSRRGDAQILARAALRAFLQGGGDE